MRKHARYSLARRWEDLNRRDLSLTTALAVRDSLIDGMIETESRYQQADAKRLYYLSMEFLMGRSLGNNLYNLGLFEACKEGLAEMGVDLEEVREREPDAALAELCRSLEQLGRSNSTAGAEGTLTLVEAEMTRVNATLDFEARRGNVNETVFSEK